MPIVFLHGIVVSRVGFLLNSLGYMAQMKILHVITTLDTGGAERLMVDLLPLLNDKGDKVELLLFNGVMTPFRQELEKRGIVVHELANIESDFKRTEVYSPLNIFRLRRFIKNYDVIHTHNTACQLYVPIARLLSGSHVKLITTEHNTTNRRRSIKCLHPVDKWMYRQYTRVICIGDSTRDNLESYLGEECHTVVIYNGVDTSRFVRPIKNVSAQDNFVITMIAGYRPQKDHETLIKSMQHLPSNYRLQLVGDGECEPQLRDLCKNLGLNERVVFMGVRMDVPDVMEMSDIIVLSSHWEGLSLSSIEGMASGRPFIASDVDGLRDIVKGAGVLFPQGDDKALASKIQHLCENPDEYHRIAEACQHRAMEYDISVMADAYYQLYHSL